MRTRALFYLAPILLSLSSLPAFALPGETSTVLEQCGAPTSQSSNIVPANSFDERTLTYGNLTMHFEPMGGRWSFTNAFRGDIALSRSELAQQMPCFGRAMAEAAAQPVYSTSTPAASSSTGLLGVPYLIPIILLTLLLIAITAWPRRHRKEVEPVPANRPYRRPVIMTVQRPASQGVRH